MNLHQEVVECFTRKSAQKTMKSMRWNSRADTTIHLFWTDAFDTEKRCPRANSAKICKSGGLQKTAKIDLFNRASKASSKVLNLLRSQLRSRFSESASRVDNHFC